MNKKPAQKTNPQGHDSNPWIHRSFALVDFRCTVRDALHSRNPQRLIDLEKMLGSFAPTYVRGDYVPLIADAYAEAVRLVNQSRECDAAVEEQMPLALSLTPVVQTVFTSAGNFRVEVRLVPVPANTKNTTP